MMTPQGMSAGRKNKVGGGARDVTTRSGCLVVVSSESSYAFYVDIVRLIDDLCAPV